MKDGKYDWMDRIACRPEDDHLFFAQDGEKIASAAKRFEQAKAICKTCPVKLECEERRRGLTPRPSEGVWAGKVFLPRNGVYTPPPPSSEEVLVALVADSARSDADQRS